MANHMKVLDSSVRQQKAVMVDVFSLVPQYVQGSLVYRLAIFRMNSLPRHLDHRRALLRVKFKTAEHLVGPVIPFVAAGVQAQLPVLVSFCASAKYASLR